MFANANVILRAKRAVIFYSPGKLGEAQYHSAKPNITALASDMLPSGNVILRSASAVICLLRKRDILFVPPTPEGHITTKSYHAPKAHITRSDRNE
jgi:hypothetical protein